MFIPIFLFLLGLGMLVKGGDLFVDGAVGFAGRFAIPELVIGATVVSIGTTLPEITVSVTSALGGHGEIAYGNAIGSIICNTSLVSALSAALRPSEVDRGTLKLPVVLFFIASLVYIGAAYALGGFGRWVGLILLAVFISYVLLLLIRGRGEGERDMGGGKGEKKSSTWKLLVSLVAGAALIAIGADLLVDNGTVIARELGVSPSVIALTFIALGTSLPELVTAIAAIAKGHGAISLGNVIGANLLNLSLATGTASVLAPFDVPNESEIFGMNESLIIDLPVMLFVMAFLTVPALIRGRLERYQGVVLLTVYACFCVLKFVI